MILEKVLGGVILFDICVIELLYVDFFFFLIYIGLYFIGVIIDEGCIVEMLFVFGFDFVGGCDWNDV